MQGILQFKL